jgi:acyl-CoA thioesterase
MSADNPDVPPPRRGTVFTPIAAIADAAAEAVDAHARTVVGRMFSQDAFSKWLGVEVMEVGEGRCELRMPVREEMTNGFGTAHGGIVFSLADTALAFCTNSSGEIAVALDCTISYPAAVRPGDVLTAVGVQESSSRKIGFAAVTIRNQDDVIVGHFRGTVYRTQKPHR